jgi:hypothetical protein
VQRWEYCCIAYRVEFQERPFRGDRFQEFIEVYMCTTKKGGTCTDSAEGTLPEESVLTVAVGQLGLEGWEMSGHSAASMDRLWFKRPKQD